MFKIATNQQPGIKSNLQRHLTPDFMTTALELRKNFGIIMPERKTLQQGCSTTLRAALDPGSSVEDGVFLSDCHFTADEKIVARHALNKENAEKLWGLSEGIVGEKFAY